MCSKRGFYPSPITQQPIIWQILAKNISLFALKNNCLNTTIIYILGIVWPQSTQSSRANMSYFQRGPFLDHFWDNFDNFDGIFTSYNVPTQPFICYFLTNRPFLRAILRLLWNFFPLEIYLLTTLTDNLGIFWHKSNN